MTRCRLDVDPEGWTVRPRTRQTRKEPTMPTIHHGVRGCVVLQGDGESRCAPC